MFIDGYKWFYFSAFREKIEEMKTIQKLRSKHNGIEITALLSESPSNNEEVPVVRFIVD